MNTLQSRSYLTEGFEYTCPLLLSAEHQSDPYLEIESFFDSASLGYYQSELRFWFKIAITQDTEVENCSGLIYLHNQLIRLFHAGYLIVKRNMMYASTNHSTGSFKNRIKDLRKQKTDEGTGKTGSYEIHLLSDAEAANPFFYLKEILNLPRIAEMREGLQEWIYCSLNGKSSIATMDAPYVFTLFDDVGKVLEMLFILTAGDEG